MDLLLNDPEISLAENVIILHVTATPYNLITKNSRYNTILISLILQESNKFSCRIDEANCHDMYESYKKENLTENNYYSIGDFVDETKVCGNSLNDDLVPGTFVKDENYEELISKNSQEKDVITLRGFIGGKLGITSKRDLASSKVEYPTR